ncbi:MAG: hypothetical protein WC177_03010 [Bacilli bacterium]
MAGLVYDQENSANYLYTNQYWWSLSPIAMYSNRYAYVYYVNSYGGLDSNIVAATYGRAAGSFPRL